MRLLLSVAIHFLACAAIVGFALPLSAVDVGSYPIRETAQRSLDGIVRQVERRESGVVARDVFTGILKLLLAETGLDKVDMLLDFASEMQDSNPKSSTFGNFRWYMRDRAVGDPNSVEFCMESGAVMACALRDRLSPAQQMKFDLLCDRAIRGCLSHRVPASYTNIAIMNAVNLLLLGEAYGRKDVFDAGMRRLDDFMLHTAIRGICEYSSQTYLSIDLDNLHRLRQFIRDKSAAERAERLLRLFWSDLVASSFVPACRLAGAHGRDYAFLAPGLGGASLYLRAVCLSGPPGQPLWFALSDWRPDDAVLGLAGIVPRTVTAMWGEEPEKVRVTWIGRHVALGISGANYWNMDLPLVVDFAAPQHAYFIADGRHDPYGRKRVKDGAHQKAVHLLPFWAGAQRGRDALGLVLYRPDDVPAGTQTLESHFVLPCNIDELFVNDERVPVKGDTRPFERALTSDDVVFARIGAGACGVRVPWMRGTTGGVARVSLARDNTDGVRAFLVTVSHYGGKGATSAGQVPGAAFWVRVEDEAGTPAMFGKFRSAFRAAAAAAKADAVCVDVSADGAEGPLALSVRAPFFSPERMEPKPPPAVLALDGRDIGLEILGDVPGLADLRANLERARLAMDAKPIAVRTDGPAFWEAEDGGVLPRMCVRRDPAAHGGACVVSPGKTEGAPGLMCGSVSWRLDVEDAGNYILWARVNAPDWTSNSFFVSAHAGRFDASGRFGPTLMPRAVDARSSVAWELKPPCRTWAWRRFPGGIALPKGPAVLTFDVRENGTAADALVLTSDVTFQPDGHIPCASLADGAMNHATCRFSTLKEIEK